MEAVSAARLRRAEQRISALRPYADAIRRMTRQAALDAGGEIKRVPLLAAHESEHNVGILLVTADRGLAGAFNSQIVRSGTQLAGELEAEGRSAVWYASGRRGGTGIPLDWEGVRRLAGARRVVIAGGLTPENVGACVRTARPYAVDVRSGVESAGVKDARKMHAFVRAVRDADAEVLV